MYYIFTQYIIHNDDDDGALSMAGLSCYAALPFFSVFSIPLHCPIVSSILNVIQPHGSLPSSSPFPLHSAFNNISEQSWVP